jgi:AmmeMemoRadiSam system protein A
MSRVVGYASIGFFAERRGELLNRVEQKRLIEIAKASVESAVKGLAGHDLANTLPMLDQKLGAFVTLRKGGELRGCIGRFSPTDIPLFQVVSQMAAAAATEDRRFYPVSKAELPGIGYEISVLSPLRRVNDWREILLGRDGVKIARGSRSGVFLPQVAAETGWDMDRFMGELCSQKAGLPRDCWKDKATELYTFTAQVFE